MSADGRPDLETPVGDLAGVGPAYVKRLDKVGIATVRDLLRHFPRRYDDLRAVRTLSELRDFGAIPSGQRLAIRAAVQTVAARRTRTGKALVTATIGDGQGSVEAVWFNQPYVAKQLKTGDEYIFAGMLKDGYGRPSLQNPSFEEIVGEQTHTARLVPVYPETEGLSSKWLRDRLKPLLGLAEAFEDELPEDIRKEHGLMTAPEAIRQIHFPQDARSAEAARYRFDFEQVLQWQLATVANRRDWQAGPSARKVPYDPAVTKRFVASLVWPLTEDQRRAAHEVLTDLDSDRPMMRLLQGDVGSGKTAVAAIAAHQVLESGRQTVLMAPTEVLAKQHAETFRRWFGEAVELVVGTMPKTGRDRAKERIAKGEAVIAVGTQALIQEGVEFADLALAIVDEQHRFGVAQREALRGGHHPHLLSMSATPIPRSLALVAFGDQDISVIRQLPPGRRPVETRLIRPSDRPQVYAEVAEHLRQGRQAFAVYPVIADSVRGLRDAESEYRRLSAVFGDFRLGLLHGRMKPEAKEAAMEAFRRGSVDLLVTTSVIEVGVDVPNASVMIVEEAQQFGLAQLHQFRGRIGRGASRSICYLVPGNESVDENERLVAMTSSSSGFELAETDLRLRGPGELLGIKQSGFELSMTALGNPELLRAAKAAAQKLLEADPGLARYPRLREYLSGTALA